MGVAGTDYNLDFVQELSQQADRGLFDGKGEVVIISNMGLIVADSEKPALIGKHFQEVMPGEGWKTVLTDIQGGKSVSSLDERTGIITALAPIHLGRTGKPWSVMIKVSKDVVLADAYTLDKDLSSRASTSAWWQVAVGLLVALGGTSFLWFAAGSLSRPIREAEVLANTIRLGDFSSRIDHHTDDEVGRLAVALNDMAARLQARAEIAERISQGDLNIEIELASSSDQLGSALQRMLDGLGGQPVQVCAGGGGERQWPHERDGSGHGRDRAGRHQHYGDHPGYRRDHRADQSAGAECRRNDCRFRRENPSGRHDCGHNLGSAGRNPEFIGTGVHAAFGNRACLPGAGIRLLRSVCQCVGGVAGTGCQPCQSGQSIPRSSGGLFRTQDIKNLVTFVSLRNLSFLKE